ncbi:hydroxymethylbilane synthase [Actinomadura xylanilytica]|uniref:hydroxymethylbilane synthase n=1 Tax=Actinomadura xylanilytica TaxID=887459 RepID=UPI00255B33F0|nr:hydroxymethylbilane synthase [Actinomadura xylanilytica]MDL4773041.1 hydroxymethylbilane synthase [Actinomadura xylanilytica]
MTTTSPATARFEHTRPRRPLRLGGRTSHLARAYARQVIGGLQAVVPGLEIEYVGIVTTADRHQGDLSELGGKGLFMKEIDTALTAGRIDAAFHCMKDVPGDVPLPEGLVFAAYLERDDVRDAVVFPTGSEYSAISELPPGSRIGTSAVRRKAQLLRQRPDLDVRRFRGNVVPRLTRLDEEREMDALVLARGGLVAVGMEHRVSQLLGMDGMCPAIGAGVVGVQCREADEGTVELLQTIDHAETRTHILAERTMLHALQGHCNSPMAGHCHTTEDGRLSLSGMVFSQDGATFAHAHEWDAPTRAYELGAHVAADLIRKNARSIIAGARPD